MDEEEAKKVVRILFDADGGCQYCVTSLANQFILAFPEYKYLTVKMFKEVFEEELRVDEE
jgi:hypothetical protein